MIKQIATLDLHQLYFESEIFVQEELEQVLDSFVTPFLVDQTTQTVLIVTGKGIHSRHFINGKNPLRYYTEQYLNNVKLSWQYQAQAHGGKGAILVEV